MKIPKQIQIAGKIFTVSYDKDLNRVRGRIGEMRYSNDEIIIDSNFNIQTKHEVFIHECLHAILNMTNDKINTDENIIPLSELLYQVIKQIDG